jgi:hypothetical protein
MAFTELGMRLSSESHNTTKKREPRECVILPSGTRASVIKREGDVLTVRTRDRNRAEFEIKACHVKPLRSWRVHTF